MGLSTDCGPNCRICATLLTPGNRRRRCTDSLNGLTWELILMLTLMLTLPRETGPHFKVHLCLAGYGGW